jgi:hypothetical protein
MPRPQIRRKRQKIKKSGEFSKSSKSGKSKEIPIKIKFELTRETHSTLDSRLTKELWKS